MNRREFLQCAAILASGTGASRLAFALSEEQSAFLAANPNYNTGRLDYLSPQRRELLAALAETIIPRTDTPGAIDAGVPAYLELMLSEWCNDTERAVFEAGFVDLETRIPEEYGEPFIALSPEQQLQVLQDMEAAVAGDRWYSASGRPGDYMSDAPFILQLKELTTYGFFTSEVGSTQVLRYDGMPMYFDGDVPLEPGQSSWAARVM